MLYVVAMLVGCADKPASFEFTGPTSIEIAGLQQTADLPAFKVIGASGNPIEPPPAVTWTVSPDTIATVAEGKITSVADGEGTATVAIGEVKGEIALVVHGPDAVVTDGLTEGQAVPVGQAIPLSGKVTGDGVEIPDMTVAWTSSDPAVATVEGGTFTAVAVGAAVVTATAGELTQSINVTVVEAPPAPPVP